MRRTLSALSVPLLATAAALAAASGCGGQDTSQPAGTSTPATVTTTVTGRPSSPAPETRTQPPPPPPPRTTRPPTTDAASTVEAYYLAINAGDYQRAWRLGGKNFNSSYESFAAGYADTAYVSVRILGVRGSTVSVRLDADQTDGTVKSFEGTYTVRGGAIVGASIREVSAPEPEHTGPGPYYENCTEVREKGVPTPIHTGEPGYAPHLDRDRDGEACEPYETPRP